MIRNSFLFSLDRDNVKNVVSFFDLKDIEKLPLVSKCFSSEIIEVVSELKFHQLKMIFARIKEKTGIHFKVQPSDSFSSLRNIASSIFNVRFQYLSHFDEKNLSSLGPDFFCDPYLVRKVKEFGFLNHFSNRISLYNSCDLIMKRSVRHDYELLRLFQDLIQLNELEKAFTLIGYFSCIKMAADAFGNLSRCYERRDDLDASWASLQAAVLWIKQRDESHDLHSFFFKEDGFFAIAKRYLELNARAQALEMVELIDSNLSQKSKLFIEIAFSYAKVDLEQSLNILDRIDLLLEKRMDQEVLCEDLSSLISFCHQFGLQERKDFYVKKAIEIAKNLRDLGFPSQEVVNLVEFFLSIKEFEFASQLIDMIDNEDDRLFCMFLMKNLNESK